MVYDPGMGVLLRHNPNHDAHGKFAPGPGGSAGGFDGSEEDSPAPKPRQLSAATNGSLQVATYDDGGTKVVAIVAGKRSHNDLDEAHFHVSQEDAPAVADGLDSMVTATHGVKPTNADPEYGPVMLAHGRRGSLSYGAYHDFNGDLVGEGESFIALSDRAKGARDVLDWPDRITLTAAEASWMAGALRQAAQA